MTHSMKLQPEPFFMIKSGQKTIELRLFDEKRRAVCVGDEILFSCADSGESLRCTVTALYRFSSFSELYAALPLLDCGYTEETVENASFEDMLQYYPKEEEARYGVLGIGIKRL